MECYACDNEGEQQCPRCGNSFCNDHGANLCAECLNPVNAAPSGGIFRLALFALFGAAVLALWLLLRPPSLPSESSGLVQPTSSAPSATPNPSGTAPASPDASATPAPAPAATASPAPAAPTPIRYTVQDGDTLSSIAAAYGVSVADLAAVNGLSNADFLSPGDELTIPQ